MKHIMQEDVDLVAVQETIKRDFSNKELKEMTGNQSFSWHWCAARGHSGGIILGVKEEDFESEAIHKGTYCLGCLVRDRRSNFCYWVICVYGPAQHECSGGFIDELTEFCNQESLPVVLGGL